MSNADDNVHLGDSLQWQFRHRGSSLEMGATLDIPTDEPDNPIRMPASLMLHDQFSQLLEHIFDHANRPEFPHSEADLSAVLSLPTAADSQVAIDLYRRLRNYIATGRNKVWKWYIANLIQPLRLAELGVTRLVGNPPWVVYNAMASDRQDTFREHAAARGLWAGANLATQNDLAATFVATCVDLYLKTGGKFGFVLPYAALRARHWANFRSGNWTLRQEAEAGTHVDLSKDAWDFYNVQAPPFPQANSSVLFGTKVPANRQNPGYKPLAKIQEQRGTGVNAKMDWKDVKPLLTYSYRRDYPVTPSPAYASEFRQGATLVPQSLVVFDEANAERALGLVRFHTEPGKGDWKGLDRDGRIEERFAKPALFSKHIIPFGTVGHLNIIAPFADDDSGILRDLPQGRGVQQFNLYWSAANADYVQIKKPKSPATLALQIDHIGKLTARLQKVDTPAVVYTQAGSWLTSAVVSSGTVIDSTLYWLSATPQTSIHYLSALFNAPALADFFHLAGRASDRHFHTGPIRNLPIPAYNRRNPHHRNLAAQSQLAHGRVAALVAERQAANRRINRNDVMGDAAMQPIFASIDESVRAILASFCS